MGRGGGGDKIYGEGRGEEGYRGCGSNRVGKDHTILPLI